jgi:hypothetical protein
MAVRDIVQAAAGAAGAAAPPVSDYRYWRFQNTTFGSESGGVSVSEWQVTTSDASITSLVGKSITNLGGAFSASFPVTNINDGTVETANANNIGYVPTADGYFDVYVDLGSAKEVTSYKIAPQGTQDTNVFNTPTAFTVLASNDASSWTTIATFSSITTGYPAWNPGTYRTFSW